MHATCVAALLALAPAADRPPLASLLARGVISPRQALVDTQEYVAGRLPRMPAVKTAAEWDEQARRIRAEVLARAY